MHAHRLLKRSRDETWDVGSQLVEVPLSSIEEYRQLPRSESALRDYWQIVCRRKWTIVLFAAAVFTLVGIAAFLTTPLYDAVGRISVSRENSDSLGLKEGRVDVSGDNAEYSMYLDAQVRILQSDTLILQVAKDLHWLNVQDQSPPTRSPEAQPASKREAELIEDINHHLDVSRVPRTPIIEIRYSNPDPKSAAEFVNGLMHAYVDQNFKTKYDSAMQVSTWLTGELQELKTKVERSQQEVVNYQRQKGILGMDDKQNIVTTKLDDLNRELTTAETDRLQKQAIYENTISNDPELLPSTSENSVIQHLKQQQAETKGQYAQATAQMGAAHPKVLELRSQLSQIDSALTDEIKKVAQRSRTAYVIATKREQMLHAALEAQKYQANQLNESAIAYNILKHDLQSNQQLYDGLLQRLKEAGVSAGLRANNVWVVDRARVPVLPSTPNIPIDLAVALLMGGLGGGMLVFILDKLDDRLRTPGEVQVTTALRPIAVIPTIAAGNGTQLLGQRSKLISGSANGTRQKVEVITYSNPKSESAESYRALRTSLLLSSAATPKVILITSALSNEGKTTTSVNCAIVMAQRGARVLLIDADLIAPKIYQALGLSCDRPGLSTLLSNPAPVTPAEVIVQSAQLSTLFVLPAGPVPDQPAELLGSNRMKGLLAQWRDQFDHIVIDTAPVLSATGSVVLSVEADAVLLTVRSGRTPKSALVRARDLLVGVGAKVTGVVMNAVDLREPGLNYYGHSYDRSGNNRTQ